MVGQRAASTGREATMGADKSAHTPLCYKVSYTDVGTLLNNMHTTPYGTLHIPRLRVDYCIYAALFVFCQSGVGCRRM